ncbi:MAG: nicotinate (nicotinamide) nucleotide adenylyltransferase [Leptolyngbyaceae bacterium]|nr:nicotinate (nicotinamide) nucleotide adenylyltransferase [Leptolyngbyaceae bacterium]
MRKVGVLGGTFNPIHWGHLLMAETALSQLQLDQVVWVPTYHPPHKSPHELLDFAHRLAMVEGAIADHPHFVVSNLESQRNRSSYAIDTLQDLQAIYPNTQWYWIIGLDAFQSLPRWYRLPELANQCHWLIAPRGPCHPDAQASCQKVAEQIGCLAIQIHWQLLEMPWVGISSSLIRSYCQAQHSIRYLLPEAVRLYIATHHLYQADQNH